MNAIFSPLGDHEGRLSDSGLFVMFCGSLPSVFITNISSLPSLVLVNAIFSPLGDHEGKLSYCGLFVMFCGSLPSVFITNISSLPSLVLVNAIFSPLGDQAGVAPSEMNVAAVPSAFIELMVVPESSEIMKAIFSFLVPALSVSPLHASNPDWRLPSGHVVLDHVVSVRSAPVRSASMRSAPVRSASVRLDPRRSAFVRLAPLKLARISTRPRRLAPLRSAPTQSTSTLGAGSRSHE